MNFLRTASGVPGLCCVVVCVLAFCFVPGLLAAQASGNSLSSPQIAELVARVNAQHSESGMFVADFVEKRISPLLKEPVVSRGRIFFLPPLSYRKETEGSLSSLVVSNGRELWMAYPEWKEVELYSRRTAAPVFQAADAFASAFSPDSWDKIFRIHAQEIPGGFHLELLPRGSLKKYLAGLEVWISEQRRITRLLLLFSDGGSVTLDLTNANWVTANPSLFEFQAPEDYKLSRPFGE